MKARYKGSKRWSKGTFRKASSVSALPRKRRVRLGIALQRFFSLGFVVGGLRLIARRLAFANLPVARSLVRKVINPETRRMRDPERPSLRATSAVVGNGVV